MAIKAFGGSGEFEKCPAGIWPALAIDVVDLGEVETPFKHEKGPLAGQTKVQHQIQIVWQVDALDENDEPARRDDGTMHRLSKYYNLSLNENATLRKDLDRWRGKAFTDEELADGWDVEAVIGAQCQVSVIHNDKGKVLVDTVLPKGRRDPEIQPDEYTREKDKPGGRDTRSPAERGTTPKQQARARSYEDQEEEEQYDEGMKLPF